MFKFDDKYALNEDEDEDEEEDENEEIQIIETPYQIKYKNYIPHILFLQSCIVSLGSGMTVKFFPLYFKQDCHYNPETV